MFIVRHKSTPFDGTAFAVQFGNILFIGCSYPVFILLSGYGGFGISVDPFFSLTHLTFIQIYGGVFVVVNVRGGGEFGEDWHMGGALKNKVRITSSRACDRP